MGWVVRMSHLGFSMKVAHFLQSCVAAPSVSMDGRAWCDRVPDERQEAVTGGVCHIPQSDAPEALGFQHLDGDHHYPLVHSSPRYTDFLTAWLGASNKGLIDFYDA